MKMRRRNAWLLLGILLIVAVAVGVYRYTKRFEVMLRLGMTFSEVEAILGPPSDDSSGSMEDGNWHIYWTKPDWLGRYQSVSVHFDSENKVVQWDQESRSLGWLGWRDWVMKSVSPLGKRGGSGQKI